MKNLTNSITEVMARICSDEWIENAWLEAGSYLELLAADQILSNLTENVVGEKRLKIIKHAEEEYDHFERILQMKYLDLEKNPLSMELAQQFKDIMLSFSIAFYSCEPLRKLKDKHASYAHGAVTIENFPFHVYTVYAEHTRKPEIKEAIESVISDEAEHIQLGMSFLGQLPESLKTPLRELQNIEKELTATLMKKMMTAIDRYEASQKSLGFEQRIVLDQRFETAWTWALAHSEKLASDNMQMIFKLRDIELPAMMPGHVEDELRHHDILRRAVAFKRRKMRKDPVYNELEENVLKLHNRYLTFFFMKIMKKIDSPELIYYYGALPLEMRVFKHYSAFARESIDVDITYKIEGILSDEAAHVHMVKNEMMKHPEFREEDFEYFLKLENELFFNMIQKSIQLLEKLPREKVDLHAERYERREQA